MAEPLKRRIHVIANDIRSRENVGAILRTAEFLGVEKVWITGYSPVPADPKVAKVSLGAEKSIAWEQVTDVRECFARLKEDGFRLTALELKTDAMDLAEYRTPTRLALVLGNEVEGVPPSVIQRCDDVVMIKRRGKKESLNVAVAAGIAMWELVQ